MQEAIPFLQFELDLLPSIESIQNYPFNKNTLSFETDDEDLLQLRLMEEEQIGEQRIGYRNPERSELPWLDGNLAICLAENLQLGEDTMLVLDYRVSTHHSRVVVSEWTDEGCTWRQAFATIYAMALSLGMMPQEIG